MAKKISSPVPGTRALPTQFVSEAQTQQLTEILDLAIDEVDQVSGGLRRAEPTCSCVNCCSTHKVM